MLETGTDSLLEELRERLLQSAELLNRFGVVKMAVFGSVLHGDSREQSDLDLLVEFKPDRTPGLGFFRLENQLSRILGRRVDLNTPGFLSPRFRDEVVTEAQTIYEQA
jgi:predicted nucleotidyltransferase